MSFNINFYKLVHDVPCNELHNKYMKDLNSITDKELQRLVEYCNTSLCSDIDLNDKYICNCSKLKNIRKIKPISEHYISILRKYSKCNPISFKKCEDYIKAKERETCLSCKKSNNYKIKKEEWLKEWEEEWVKELEKEFGQEEWVKEWVKECVKGFEEEELLKEQLEFKIDWIK